MKLALGAPRWIRTTGLRLRSPLLYPAELSGLVGIHYQISFCRMRQKLHLFVIPPLN